MNRSLTIKLARDLKSNWGQFAASGALVALGVLVYVGMFSAYSNLRESRDDYYRNYRFADFWIELERAPASAIRRVDNIPGVWDAQGRIVKDVPLDVEGNEESVIGRIISLPDDPETAINGAHLIEGSWFSGVDEREVIVNLQFCEANELDIGDTFEATLEGRRENLRIVGKAYSPEYVYSIRNPQQLYPSDATFAVIFVQREFAESALNMGNAFNSVVGLLGPGANREEVLDRAEDALDPYGVFYSYGRDQQLSNTMVDAEMQQLRVMALMLPTVFLFIAALAVHVIMSRIIDQQRTQIGLMRSLGYSGMSVAFHYIGHSLAVALGGALAGVLLGQWTSQAMTEMYVDFFAFPELYSRVYPEHLGVAFIISSAACILGMVYSVRRISRLQPAESMRPPAPPTGRKIFLEKISFVWNSLSLGWRTTIRGAVRARVRTMLTICGVAVATAIVMWGNTFQDLFEYLVWFQFQRADVSDIQVEFFAENPYRAVGDLSKIDGVKKAEGYLRVGVELKNGRRTNTVLVTGVPPNAELVRVFDLDKNRLHISGNGLLIPDRLADELAVGLGSNVMGDPHLRGKDETEFVVRGIIEQFIGLTTYADLDYLCGRLGEGRMINSALLEVEEEMMESIIEELNDMPAVATVTASRRMMDSFRETSEELIVGMAIVITVFAGLIAFAVIYNASTISISERERELASMRTMGIGSEQAADIATKDILPLGAIGLLAGLGLGRLALMGMERSFVTDIYKIPIVTYPQSYMMTAVSVLVFLLISRSICRRKVAKIDIIKAIKTRE